MPVKLTVKKLQYELNGKEFVDDGVRWRVHDVIYDATHRTHMVLYADVRCRYHPPRQHDLESSTVTEVRKWLAASAGGGSAGDADDDNDGGGDDDNDGGDDNDDANEDSEDNDDKGAATENDDDKAEPTEEERKAKRLARLKRQLGDTLGTGDLYYRKYLPCVQSADGTSTSTVAFRKQLYED